MEGSSLSDFVLAELEKVAFRPTPRELRERLRQRAPVHLKPPAADAIRERRDRGQELDVEVLYVLLTVYDAAYVALAELLDRPSSPATRS